jgi:anti-sigma regulatory factor (Ser/Thr protein kinase)
MAEDLPPFTLTLPTDGRMVNLARGFIEAVCQSCHLDPTTIHAVVLAAGEAVSNVLRHAHQNRPEATLQIHCWAGPDYLELQFLDEGDPFDLDAVPCLDPTEMRLGGRGVFLMRTLMDEVYCQPRPPRGNLLRMIKRWSPTGAVRECG